MAKHCQTFDHTADVGLSARADSLAELYEALAEGLADLICPRGQVRPAEARALEVHAEDREALAVDFLSAVLNRAESEHFLPAAVAVQMTGPTALKADLRGEPYDPARHEIGAEVKAVTYHRLRVVQEGGQWVGTVVLDL